MALTNLRIYANAPSTGNVNAYARNLRAAHEGIERAGSEARSEHARAMVESAVALKYAGIGAPKAAELAGYKGASEKGNPARSVFQRHFRLAALVVSGAAKAPDVVRLVIEQGVLGALRALTPKRDRTTDQALQAALSRACSGVRSALNPSATAGFTVDDLVSFLREHGDTREGIAQLFAQAADLVGDPDALETAALEASDAVPA